MKFADANFLRQDTLKVLVFLLLLDHRLNEWTVCGVLNLSPSSSFQNCVLDGFNLRQFSSNDCIKLESNWGKVISGKIPSQEIFYLRKLYTEAANSEWKA